MIKVEIPEPTEKYTVDFLDKFNSVRDVINHFAGHNRYSVDSLDEICAEVGECLMSIYYIDRFILEDFFIRIGYVHELYYLKTPRTLESDICDFAKYVKRAIKSNFARVIERKVERDYAMGKSQVRELLSGD